MGTHATILSSALSVDTPNLQGQTAALSQARGHHHPLL
eukprot:jgi/Chlat1/4536/Chrsp29S04590